jgi:2-oxoglutarate ferredoxin oxidoreductase subunit beta
MTNEDSPVDTVSLALLMGASFVARSFSGDKQQLVPLIKAAIAHQGAAFIDVISPCVAFNNHPGSTKSYDYVREHNEVVNRLDFWPTREAIHADYAEGDVIEVPAGAEGSILRLRKLDTSYDPTDKVDAMTAIARAAEKGEVLTGLLYVSADAEDLHRHLNTYDARPFNQLVEKDLCPGAGMLEKINSALR